MSRFCTEDVPWRKTHSSKSSIPQYHLSEIHVIRTRIAVMLSIAISYICSSLRNEKRRREMGVLYRKDRRSRGEGIQRLALNLTLDSTAIRVLSRIISMAPGLTDRDRHRYCHRNIWVSGSIRRDREVRAIRGIVGAQPSPESAAESIFVTQMNSRICGRGENRGSRKRHFLEKTDTSGSRTIVFFPPILRASGNYDQITEYTRIFGYPCCSEIGMQSKINN